MRNFRYLRGNVMRFNLKICPFVSIFSVFEIFFLFFFIACVPPQIPIFHANIVPF